MSRVYSIMTGTSAAAPVAAPADEESPADEPFVAVAEDTENPPFIEIGGPGGPVFSASPAPLTLKPLAEVRAKSDTARAYPRIAAPAQPPAGEAQVLSVQFHNLAPHAPGRAPGGPDPGLVVLHYPEHPVSGEYRTLRDEISAQLADLRTRVLTFAAAAPEAGTTTVLLNLGITLARDGKRVLVLDANATRPTVAAKLALTPAPGLAEVLGGEIPLSWALQPTAAPHLQALTTGSPDDAEKLAGAIGRDLPKLIGQLRQWFDWVLIDAGVWGVEPDRDATCSAADAVYLVSREADANRPEFTGLRAGVKQLRGALRGYVTTRV